MRTNYWYNIFNSLLLMEFFTGCQFNQTELTLEKLHNGEEVFCTSHPNLIGYTQAGENSTTFWVNVQVLKAPWETINELRNPPPVPLQAREPGTKVAVFSVKKSSDSKPLTSYEPYQLVKRDLVEGENIMIGKKRWQVVSIGLGRVRVNGNEHCRSGFVYIREINLGPKG